MVASLSRERRVVLLFYESNPGLYKMLKWMFVKGSISRTMANTQDHW